MQKPNHDDCAGASAGGGGRASFSGKCNIMLLAFFPLTVSGLLVQYCLLETRMEALLKRVPTSTL